MIKKQDMNNINFDIIYNNGWWTVLLIVILTIGRYAVLAGTAYLIFYRAGIRKLKQFKIQVCPPEKKQIAVELFYSLFTVFIFSGVGIAIYFLYLHGYTTIYTDNHAHSRGYFILTVAGMIFVHDTYFYWTHRLLHTKWLFKKVHVIHHRSVNPSPLSAYAFHPAEAFIESLVVFPFVTIFPVHIGAFLLFTFLVLVMNVIGHLGYELIPDKIRFSKAGQWFTSSTHHNLHHQRIKKNFSYYFTLWDRMMKTLQQESLKTSRTDIIPGREVQKKSDQLYA